MFLSPQTFSLPTLTGLSHLVNYGLETFFSSDLTFQEFFNNLTLLKLFLQRENNLWFLRTLRANGCHPRLIFRHTVSGEPGSVCIKPASCHSILTSTIEKQRILHGGWTGRITTALGTHMTAPPDHLAWARNETYSPFHVWPCSSQGPSLYYQFLPFFLLSS